MSTPKDFKFLSERIFEENHVNVSSTTLKRIWGYLQNDNSPRSTTLNILANYVGYEDWDNYLESAEKVCGTLPEEPEPETPINNPKFNDYKTKLKAIFLSTAASETQMLRKGKQSYATMDECLELFGITACSKKHYQAVPNLNNIYVWCPTYHHPVWQNDGDSTQLLPTITERWTPAPEQNIPQIQVSLYRSRAYMKAIANRELRLTFMRGVIDSTFTFLGIYRLSPRSNEDSLVWERIADECNINNLGLMEKLIPTPIPANLEIEDDSLFRTTPQ